MTSDEFPTLAEMCVQQARTRPDATAFIFGNESRTFYRLDIDSNRVAHGLKTADIGTGSRVAILGKDSFAHYEILFGCAKAKSVLVDLNWRLASPEILFILNDSESKILFVSSEFFPIVEALAAELTTVKAIIALDGEHSEWANYEQWKSGQSDAAIEAEYNPEDVAVQMYSSGTTGRPKGVQLANDSFFKLMQGVRAAGDRWMNLNPDDVLLLSLPQFHIGGLWWAIQGYAAGAAGVIVDTFVAWQALQFVEQHKITKAVLVPAMLQLMLDEPSCDQADLSSMQGIVYGGSPISPALLRKAMSAFGCDFFQIYGLTETGNCAVCLRPEDHASPDSPRLKAAGRPFPGVEIKILDNKKRSLPPMRSGEICIKSPSNMLGYWNNPSATEQTLVDGWIHTGDVGYMDQDGYVYVCDRIKDMIIYAGENLFPAEIEAVLSEHEAVAEVAVIGIPDEKWGEVVKAFVVPRQGGEIKQRELINFARSRIADFKVPKSIAFVDALPRNPSGKILKRILRAPYWQDHDRQVS